MGGSGLQALADAAQLAGEVLQGMAGGLRAADMLLVGRGNGGQFGEVLRDVLGHRGLLFGGGGDLPVHVADRLYGAGDALQHGAGLGDLLVWARKNDKFDFLKYKSKLILDKNQDIYSPILALQTILEKFDKVFIITVDTPFVKIETIEKLINHSNNFEITISQTSQRTHNLCGVFSNNLNETIEKMIKNDIHKINYLVKN